MSATIRVHKTKDYTIMSNHHLRNRNLSLKAKGLMSLFLSLPEKWKYTIDGLASISKEGTDSISAGIKELERAGYIIRNRERDAKGKMGGMEYEIYEYPIQTGNGHNDIKQTPAAVSPASPQDDLPVLNDPEAAFTDECAYTAEPDLISSETPPVPDIPDAVSPIQEEPVPENPIRENPGLDSPAQEKPVRENPSLLNTNQVNPQKEKTNPFTTDGSIHPSINHESARIQVFDLYESIREQIEYDCLRQNGDRERLDEMVELIAEVLSNAKPTMDIAKGEYATPFVQHRFRLLRSQHIDAVLKALRQYTGPVGNMRSFALSCLFNEGASYATKTEQQVTHDLYERSKPVELPF